MRFGKYKHRISIYELQRTRDDTGGYSVSGLTLVAERWAEVIYLSGKELSYAQQNTASYDIEINLRHIDLNEEMVIAYNGKMLEIKSIIPDDTNTELILYCVENKNPITFTNYD